MLDREACERRVYRLAALLTGNPIAATKVIAQVVDAQPDVRQLDSSHMDRLTVLRSRDIAPATLVHDLISPAVAAALASLSAQQREAWVFGRVYQMSVREMSKAMDCSVTATQRHLDAADAGIAARLGDQSAAAAESLRAFSMTLDLPAFYRRQQSRRRRLRRIIFLTAAVLVLFGLAAAFMWWRAQAAAAH